MFPIIPHHLRLSIDAYPSPKVTHLAPVTGVPSWESMCPVVAAEDIVCDVTSEEFAPESLMTDRSPIDEAVTRRVTLTKEGRFTCSTWVQHVRLSADCHTCNVLLQRGVDDDAKLRLQVIRPLREGDELHMWFAQPTLAALAVPFLRPANIQGDKRYVCHICTKPFETPNPLKLHLALGCCPIDKNRLYSRLVATKTPSRRDHEVFRTSQDSFAQIHVKADPDAPSPRLGPANIFLQIKAETDVSIKREPEAMKSLQTRLDGAFRFELPPRSRVSSPTSDPGCNGVPRANTGSAFRPYWKPRQGGEVDRRSPDERAQVGSFHPGGESMYFAQAREMETLVSNLGRSKHGHLCVYCGKVYSRKYGLKIHIRTHTGFKPLQCRHCLRPFGDPSNLNKHVRLHAEGSTPYKCDLCGKVLVRRRDLERHIKSRHAIDSTDS